MLIFLYQQFLIFLLLTSASTRPIEDADDDDFDWDTDAEQSVEPVVEATSEKQIVNVTPETHIQKIPRKNRNKTESEKKAEEEAKQIGSLFVPIEVTTEYIDDALFDEQPVERTTPVFINFDDETTEAQTTDIPETTTTIKL